jgi:hypothetical protein
MQVGKRTGEGWVGSSVSRCRVGCVYAAGTNVNRCGECRTAVSKAAIRRSGVGGGKKEDGLGQESSRRFKQGRCSISMGLSKIGWGLVEFRVGKGHGRDEFREVD